MAKNNLAADHLRSLIERIERLMEEKAGIQADITEVFSEAKGNGFDPKVMRTMIKLRAMDASEREEYEGLVDIYKAALGMLNGTPLGEAAIKRLSKKPDDDEAPASAPAQPGPAGGEPEESPAPVDERTIDDARRLAQQAAESGQPVTANPFPARDPRRAAWDEEWCRHTGQDGMELPEAWRRSKKPKGEGKEKGGEE